MTLILTIPPLEEPISLAEAKLHLRVDHGDDDSLISNLIIACRQSVESHINTALIEQTWVWSFDKWADVGKFSNSDTKVISNFAPSSGRYVPVPRGPLISVVSIKTYNSDGVESVWSLSNILTLLGDKNIYLKFGATWPLPSREAGGVEITYNAGLGASASDVPASIRQAILQLVAYHYEQRGLDEGQVAHIPAPVLAMLAPYKMRKL